jgi:hypothetical protein
MTRRLSGIYAVLSGILIAAALFALVFWVMARFMPAFLAFTNSRWTHLLPAFVGPFLVFVAWVMYRAKRRRAV